jgi:hypothetical protein
MANRPASLIELDPVPLTDDPDGNNPPGIPNAAPANRETGQTLCDRCKRFDIRSFSRGAGRSRGYLLRDVEASAAAGCAFCTLLLGSVAGVERPTYFGSQHFFRPFRKLDPTLWLHMTVSEDYVGRKVHTGSPEGMRVNRMLVEVGDRFSHVRAASGWEVCLAAEEGC